MNYTRREMGHTALAALSLSGAKGAAHSSNIQGVQIGVITYSFRGMTSLDNIIRAIVDIGLNEVELMSATAETAAGAPPARFGPGPGRGPSGGPPGAPPSPEQRAAMRARMNSPEAQQAREELRKWRLAASLDAFKPVRQKFVDAAIDLHLLCFNMNESFTDDEIDYVFQVARTLGVRAITTSTQVTVSKRVAPFADKYKLLVGYHGHDNVQDHNEFSTQESFETAMSYSKYNGMNLDIGHFVAANEDPLQMLEKHHARVTNLHLKDRKKSHGPNMAWGQGDTPIREVLQLMKKRKFRFPANIEYEYRGESDPVSEVKKCFQFCKDALG